MTETLIGDLHDGAGLSDATEPNGVVSNTVFESADYDLLAIGVPSSHMNRARAANPVRQS